MSPSKKQRGVKGQAPATSVAPPVHVRAQEVVEARVESSPRQPAKAMTTPSTPTPAPNELALRLLGDALAREVMRSGASVVLIVSGRAGEGRTTLSGALATALRELSSATVHRFSMREMHGVPDVLEGTVVIDGPALLEGEGPLAIPSAWWAAIDGAIVITSARDVPVDDLASVGRELELRGVKRLALVANERDRPPVARAIRDAVNAFLRRTFLARWMRTEAHVERIP